MDRSINMKELIEQVKTIEQYMVKYNNLTDIPQIEKDLMLDKLRLLYESISQQKEVKKEISSGPEKKEDEKPIEKESGKEVPVPENKDDDLFHIEAEDKKVEPENKIEQKVEHKETKTTIAEKYKVEDRLNESRTKDIKPDLASRLQSKPIKDISASIGLNDRFTFISQLFKGDAKKYDQTISVLNDANDFNAAYRHIDENLEWDMNDENVQKILELVRRKHIMNTNE